MRWSYFDCCSFNDKLEAKKKEFFTLSAKSDLILKGNPNKR